MVLAYEITKLIHGEAEAKKAEQAAKALFGGGAEGAEVPSTDLDQTALTNGLDIIGLLSHAGLIASNSEGRRLIKDGGIYLNGERISDHTLAITPEHFTDGKLMIRKGKKVYHQIILK